MAPSPGPPPGVPGAFTCLSPSGLPEPPGFTRPDLKLWLHQSRWNPSTRSPAPSPPHQAHRRGQRRHRYQLWLGAQAMASAPAEASMHAIPAGAGAGVRNLEVPTSTRDKTKIGQHPTHNCICTQGHALPSALGRHALPKHCCGRGVNTRVNTFAWHVPGVGGTGEGSLVSDSLRLANAMQRHKTAAAPVVQEACGS